MIFSLLFAVRADAFAALLSRNAATSAGVRYCSPILTSYIDLEGQRADELINSGLVCEEADSFNLATLPIQPRRCIIFERRSEKRITGEPLV